MYIDSKTYFEVKANTQRTIDIVFKRRPLDESNIARLEDDEVEASRDAEEQLISEILFYYILWKKIGWLPVYIIERIKRHSNEILTSNQTFTHLNAEEYNDFIKIVHEVNESPINIFSDNK